MIWQLLVVFQVKHLLCDYPLQFRWMLGKFSPNWREWVPALAAHASVHALATFFIALYFGSHEAAVLGVADFWLHAIMDRIKASPDLMGRWKALSAGDFQRLADQGTRLSAGIALGGSVEQLQEWRWEWDNIREKVKGNTYFWWALGFDQFIHHLTHYFIIWRIVATS
jgi:hypothetical protein